jgi:uncharacterized protein (DUF1684 family)
MQGYLRIALGALALFASARVQALEVDSNWGDQLKTWRTDHATTLSAPDGWLSLVGLEWLKPGDNAFGGAPEDRIHLQGVPNVHLGVIHLEQHKLVLKAPAGGFLKELRVDGHPATEQTITVDGPKPTTLTAGTLTFYVIHRGDQEALRIKDTEARTRVDFHGLHWFAPDPSFKIEAEWVPLAEPKQVTVQSVVGTTSNGLVPGYAKFKLHGQEIQLEPVVQKLDVGTLLFVVRDATSGKTTYAAARFLHTGLPDHGLRASGKITLDFNRLENPPCAYTPFATCPLPPESNRLKVAIDAGELKYSH